MTLECVLDTPDIFKQEVWHIRREFCRSYEYKVWALYSREFVAKHHLADVECSIPKPILYYIYCVKCFGTTGNFSQPAGTWHELTDP